MQGKNTECRWCGCKRWCGLEEKTVLEKFVDTLAEIKFGTYRKFRDAVLKKFETKKDS